MVHCFSVAILLFTAVFFGLNLHRLLADNPVGRDNAGDSALQYIEEIINQKCRGEGCLTPA